MKGFGFRDLSFAERFPRKMRTPSKKKRREPMASRNFHNFQSPRDPKTFNTKKNTGSGSWLKKRLRVSAERPVFGSLFGSFRWPRSSWLFLTRTGKNNDPDSQKGRVGPTRHKIYLSWRIASRNSICWGQHQTLTAFMDIRNKWVPWDVWNILRRSPSLRNQSAGFSLTLLV